MIKNNKFPEKVCQECMTKISDISAFIDKCKSNQSMLLHIINVKSEATASKDDQWDESVEFFSDNDPSHIVSKKEEFQCANCGKSFSLKKDLVLHIRMHSEIGPYSCSNCNLCFKSEQNLTQHQVIHNRKSHKCHICGKGDK